MSSPEMTVLGLFDNPVFQSELLFLLVVMGSFAMIGLSGRSTTLGIFGSFLFLIHVVTAVGSGVPELNTAFWVVAGVVILVMMFRVWGAVRGGGAPA